MSITEHPDEVPGGQSGTPRRGARRRCLSVDIRKDYADPEFTVPLLHFISFFVCELG